MTPSSEVDETCPGGGVAGLPDENSPNSDNNSPGAMEVTGFKSAASRTQAMGVCGRVGVNGDDIRFRWWRSAFPAKAS